MNKKNIIAVLILPILTFAIFQYFSGREYIIKFTKNQLQEKLESKLPLTKNYLLFRQVTLENPRITLKNGSDRVDFGLDVKLNIKLKKEPKPLGGTIDVSGGIKYVSEQGQLFLTDPAIENIHIQGIPEKYTDKVNIAMSKALNYYYDEHPIYTLKTTDIKQATAKLILKNIQIEHETLVVTLGL